MSAHTSTRYSRATSSWNFAGPDVWCTCQASPTMALVSLRSCGYSARPGKPAFGFAGLCGALPTSARRDTGTCGASATCLNPNHGAPARVSSSPWTAEACTASRIKGSAADGFGFACPGLGGTAGQILDGQTRFMRWRKRFIILCVRAAARELPLMWALSRVESASTPVPETP